MRNFLLMQIFSDTLLLETELVQLTVRAEDYYVHNLGYGVKGHLDTQIVLKADRTNAPEAQGILGQTVNASLVLSQQVIICNLWAIFQTCLACWAKAV